MDTQRLSQTVQPLLDWFQAHARTLPWRADREPYHVWLSDSLLCFFFFFMKPFRRPSGIFLYLGKKNSL